MRMPLSIVRVAAVVLASLLLASCDESQGEAERVYYYDQELKGKDNASELVSEQRGTEIVHEVRRHIDDHLKKKRPLVSPVPSVNVDARDMVRVRVDTGLTLTSLTGSLRKKGHPPQVKRMSDGRTVIHAGDYYVELRRQHGVLVLTHALHSPDGAGVPISPERLVVELTR